MPEQKYVIDCDASTMGTSLQGEVVTSYTTIVKRFGPPTYDAIRAGKGDGKCSTQWVFRHRASSSVFTVYDYKETNLYGRGLPTVKAFRAKKSYAWHIGGRQKGDATIFAHWLGAMLRQPVPAPKKKTKAKKTKTTRDHMAEVGQALGD